MIPIQPVLISFFILAIVIYFSKFRSRFWDRAIVLAIVITGIVFIAHPDFTNALARALGVGRGADLLLYLTLPGLGFIGLLLFLKIQDLQHRLALLTREIALITAEDRSIARQNSMSE